MQKAVLQNLRKPDQIYPNVSGLLFASCFNEAAQGNKAWFSPEHSPEWGILQWRTNPIFPQVSRPLHRLTRWNSPPKTRYSKMDDTVKSHGLPRKPHHFGEICIDLERNHENSCNPASGAGVIKFAVTGGRADARGVTAGRRQGNSSASGRRAFFTCKYG